MHRAPAGGPGVARSLQREPVEMGLDVIIGLVTITLAIIGVGLTLGRFMRKLDEKLDGVRGEFKGDIKGLRGELQGGIKGLRDELRSDISSLRDELRSDISSLRDELRSDIKGVRGEMTTMRTELRGEIKGVRTELGGRIDVVAAELARTRMAVARIEGSVLGIPLPDTGTDPA